MTTDTYSIQVAVDSTSAVTATRNLTAMEQATGRSERALSGLGSVAKIAGSALAGISIASLARDILKINIEFENMRAQLLSVTGSSVMAAKAMADIQKISRETPQSLQEITKSYMMLKNFGIEPTIQVMRDLTNITSKVGGDADTLSGIIRQLGQAYAKNKLQAEDANSIIERGIPIYSLLSQVTGKTTSEVLKMMEAGKITRPVIEDLIHAMGGSAVDASANKMQTLGGKVDMLGEAWHNFEDVLLNDKASWILGNIVSGMIKSIDYLTERFGTSVGKQIADLEVSVAAAKKHIPENKSSAFYAAYNESYMQQQIMLDQLKRQKQLADAEAANTTEKIKNDKTVQKSQDETIRLRDLEIKRVKEFGTATQQENQALKEAKDTYGEVTASMKEQIHQKYFHIKLTKEESAAKKESAKAAKDLAEAERYFNEQLNAQVAAAENAGKLFAAQQQTKLAGIEAEKQSIIDKASIEYEHAVSYEEKSRILNESQNATNALLAKEKEIRDAMTNQSSETIDAKIAAAQAELDNAGQYNLTLAEQLRLKTEIARLQTDKAILGETSTQSDIKAKAEAEQKANDDKIAALKAIDDAQTAANEKATAQMAILTANLDAAKEAATGLSEAFGDVGGAIGGLGVAMASYEKSQAAITAGLEQQLFQIQKENEGKGDQVKKDKAISDANQKQSQLQVKSYGDMASAAQGFFKKGTAGYNALGVATKVFRAFEMAQSAMSMVRMIADNAKMFGAFISGIFQSTAANQASVLPNVVADGAKATASGTAAVASASAAPFPIGFATGAAMLAFMLAIGVAMSGGGSSAPQMTGAEYEQKQQDNYSASIKGSVLGGDGYSKSIVDSLDTISSNSTADLDYSLGLLRSMDRLASSVDNLVVMTAKQLNIDVGNLSKSVNFGTTKSSNSPLGSSSILNFLAFGLLGGLFSSTTVTKSFAGAGIELVDQTLGNIIAKGIKGAQTYVDVLVTSTKKSFFGMFKSVKQQIVTSHKELSDSTANAISYTIVRMYDTIVTAAQLTGNNAISQLLKNTTISLGKIPLGKDPSKYEEILQATMSGLADRLAKLDPRFKEFQQIGEGYYQTLTRVSVSINTAETKLRALGVAAIHYTDIVETQGDVEREMIVQSLQLASSYTDVNDILGKLPGTADDIIDAFNGLNSIKFGLAAIGASSVMLTQDMINVAGGISSLDSTLTSYIDNYLTKTEQSVYHTGLLTDKFTKLGLVLPMMGANADDAKSSFRSLLDTLAKDTTDAGRGLYIRVLGMASDFADAATESADLLSGDLKEAADLLTSTLNTATTELNNAYKALITMRDKFAGIATSLQSYLGELNNTASDYDNAKALFLKTSVLAKDGNEKALQDMTSVSKAFLTASKTRSDAEIKSAQDSVNATKSALTSAQDALTQAQEEQAAAQLQASKDALSNQKQALGDQVSALKESVSTIIAFRDKLLNVSKSLEVYLKELTNTASDYDNASAEFLRISALAKKGDEQALQDLESASKNFLNISKTQIDDSKKIFEESVNVAKTGLKSAYDSIVALQDKFKSIRKSLADYKLEITGAGMPQGSPESVYQSTKKAFEDANILAASGNEQALTDLPNAAKAFLDASLKYNATGAMYQTDYQSVLNALDKATVVSDGQIDILNKQLTSAQSADKSLIDLNANALSIDESIKAYKTALESESQTASIRYEEDKALVIADATKVKANADLQIIKSNKQIEKLGEQITLANTQIEKLDGQLLASEKVKQSIGELTNAVNDAQTAYDTALKYQSAIDTTRYEEDKSLVEKNVKDALAKTNKQIANADLQLTAAENANIKLEDLKTKTDTVSSSILTMSTAISSYVAAQVAQEQAAAQTQIQAAQAAAAQAAQVQAAADALPIKRANAETNKAHKNETYIKTAEWLIETGARPSDFANVLFYDYGSTEQKQLMPNIPAYANGGMASGLSLVGEKGAELVNFNSPANVTSHSQTTGLFDSIGEAMNDQNIILEDQVTELKALVNLQSNANMVLINEMKGMREELSTISRKAKLEAAA